MVRHKLSLTPAVVLALPLAAAVPIWAKHAVGLPGLARRPRRSRRTPGAVIERALDERALDERARVLADTAVTQASPRNHAAEDFDWQRAGVGAGGAQGLAALFFGAGLPVPRSRRRA